MELWRISIGHGTKLRWFLRENSFPVGHEVSKKGFIGILYKGEIYNITDHFNSYISYGISEKEVRNKLWLLLEPPHHKEGEAFGVFPMENRNFLAWGSRGGSLPHDEWSDYFSNHVPEVIVEASNRAHREVAASDDEAAVQEELLKLLGSLWEVEGYKDNEEGEGGKRVRPRHEHEPQVQEFLMIPNLRSRRRRLLYRVMARKVESRSRLVCRIVLSKTRVITFLMVVPSFSKRPALYIHADIYAYGKTILSS